MKNKGIIALSHCILNKFSVVETSNPKKKDIGKLLNFLLENNMGIIQLPCPETQMYGLKRWGHVRDQFDTPFFRKTSSKLLEPFVVEVEDYIKNDYTFIGIVGIDGSPSCGINISCASPEWGGDFKDRSLVEDKLSTLDYLQDKGIFMEVLEKDLASHELRPKFFGLLGDEVDKLIQEISSYLSEIEYN